MSLTDSEIEALRAWLAAAGEKKEQAAAAGYQGQVHLYQSGDLRLAVKEASGFGPLLWIRRWMLRREHDVYRRLGDFEFVPRCLGLLDERYLVLEWVAGVPYRKAEFQDRDHYFAELLEAIRELHRRGVAHGDLKRKENLLVIDGRRPCLLDLGTAIVAEAGLRPLNRWLFRTLRQYDLNAWAKLKSNRQIDELSPEEQSLYRRSTLERIARFFKKIWSNLKASLSRSSGSANDRNRE